MKVNVALELPVGSVGPVRMTVSGRGRIVQLYAAGFGSTVLASFVARTSRTCSPGRSADRWYGVEQDEYGALSSAHSKSASGSLDENVNSASGLSVEAGGPVSIVVSGGTTVHSYAAGVASTLPTAFTARTCRS